jgi:hypothetical protein
VRVLRFLEEQNCPFVPRLVESYTEELRIVTTSCGSRVEHIDDARAKELFDELETYGVRHDDAEVRNITLSADRWALLPDRFRVRHDPAWLREDAS